MMIINPLEYKYIGSQSENRERLGEILSRLRHTIDTAEYAGV